jgi:hypothetical protein
MTRVLVDYNQYYEHANSINLPIYHDAKHARHVQVRTCLSTKIHISSYIFVPKRDIFVVRCGLLDEKQT